MKFKTLIIISGIFMSFMASGFSRPVAKSANCNGRISSTKADSLAVTFICSPHTKGVLALDRKMTAALNEVFQYCPRNKVRNQQQRQRNWLSRRNQALNVKRVKNMYKRRINRLKTISENC